MANGPVHINVPMKEYSRNFNTENLPEVTKFDRLTFLDNKKDWDEKIDKLKKANKILITCGQKSNVSEKLRKELKEFFKRYNCTVSVEYMSNLGQYEGIINTTLGMDIRFINKNKFKEFIPEIVISFGGNIMSGIKENLKRVYGEFEHWSIQEDGRVVDMYKSLTTIFECSPEYFFEYCNRQNNEGENNKIYHNSILEYCNKVEYPDFKYSSVYAIKNVVEKVPENSILHLSINNSIRITNFFKINPSIKVYANIGTYGIDGCMSSFLGQSVATKNLSYLIIGDLSFFYDMNSLRIKHIKNNVRILLINNHGGAEFHYNGFWIDEQSDLHTSARHTTKAKGWAESLGFEYLSSNDKETFDKSLKKFMRQDSERPILFEVFTDMQSDTDVIFDFYEMNRPKVAKDELIKKGKVFAKNVLGEDTTKRLKKLLKK